MPSSRPVSTTEARSFFRGACMVLVACVCAAVGWSLYLQQALISRQRETAELTLTPTSKSAPVKSEPASEPVSETGEPDERPYEEPVESSAATERAKGVADTQESRQRQAVIGHWEDDYHGKRHLALHEDGSAIMVFEPAGLGKALFAPKLIFDAEWKIEEGKLHLWTKGGEPKAKVRMVLKMFGDRAVQDILELTGDRLRLRDADGKTEYEWRRIMAVANATE